MIQPIAGFATLPVLASTAAQTPGRLEIAASGRMLDALLADPDRTRQGDANCP
ncbi:MAG: hypothetical protein AB7O88_07470 [Reyranellaceae bacterium]